VSPTCGFCGAVFAKVTDAEDHGLAGHPWIEDGEDVVYYEGILPATAMLARRVG